MSSDLYQEVKSLIAKGDSYRDQGVWVNARINYDDADNELNAIIEAKTGNTETENELKDAIKNRLISINEHYSVVHRDKGLIALKNKAWQIAVEELDEAIRLAKVDNVEFLEKTKKMLDVANSKLRDCAVKVKIDPFVVRGNDFFDSGNYGEAMLEYQEAMKMVENLNPKHRYYVFISSALRECRRSIIRPYLAKVYRASKANKYAKAAEMLKRASLLIDSSDGVYGAFLSLLKENIAKHLDNKDIPETEEFEAPEVWEKAIKDYEEALSLYSSYSLSDPLAPLYADANIFEDRFYKSRRRLGKLYKTRADRLRDEAKVEKAIRNYKEAIKLLPRSDRLAHEAFRELKKLRTQVLSAK